jgi:hypothetical protein
MPAAQNLQAMKKGMVMYMANYTVISDIGNALVKLLQDNIVPDVILNSESIGLCSPDDKGDIQLGLYLYDIKECDEYRNSTMINIDAGNQRYPSEYLTLYYMITAYSNGDIKYRSLEEHKVLGRVIQVLYDNSIIDAQTMEPVQRMDTGIRIEMMQLNFEDKVKIWNVPDKSYKTSLFYKVSPVELESSRIKSVQRVVDMDFTIES